VQADIIPILCGHSVLQKSTVGIDLGRQKKRHFQDTRPFAEILTYAFSLGERIGHIAVPRFNKIFNPDAV
jgi:hypothetical protein